MDEFEFEGFDVPGTTPVPDVVFDKLLNRLTGNELKVLLYIIRRTYGFGKNADAISLSQFREGIKTRDENGNEKVLDEGCGIGHNRTILVALASLEQKGCVTSKKRNTNAGDSDTTIYKLRFKSANKKASKAQSDNGVVTSGNHVVTPGNEGSYSTSPRWLPQVTTVVTSGNTQETVLQYTDKQETVLQGDTFSASIDSAALTQLQNENASLKARLEQLLSEIKNARNPGGNDTPSDTPLSLAGNNTAVDGGNDQLPDAREMITTDHTAIPEPVVSPTMPLTESQGIVALPDQDKPPVGEYSASETPSSTQAVKDLSNQATEQGKQASGDDPIAVVTTKTPQSDTMPVQPATQKTRGGRGKSAAAKEEKPKLEVVKTPPQMPPAEMAWGTRKCMQKFDARREKLLIGTYAISQASTCAKGLAENYTEEDVDAVTERMNNDPYWIARGGADICDVARNIHKEIKKIKGQNQPASSRSGSKQQPVPVAYMTHDEACKLAHDVIAEAKQYDITITAEASPTKNDAWVVCAKWHDGSKDGLELETIKVRAQWSRIFQQIRKMAAKDTQRATRMMEVK